MPSRDSWGLDKFEKNTLLTFQGQPNTQCTWWRNDHFLAYHATPQTYTRSVRNKIITTAMPAIAFGRRAFLGGPVTQWRTVTHRSQSWFEALRAGPYHLVAAWQGHQTCPSSIFVATTRPVVDWCFMVFHGVSWCFMVFHGVSWCFMVFHGVSWCFMVFHGVSWCFMVFHGVSWCFCEWKTHNLKLKTHSQLRRHPEHREVAVPDTYWKPKRWCLSKIGSHGFFSMHKPKSQKSLWHGKTTSRSNSYKVHAAPSKFTLAFPHLVWREALTCPKHLDMSDFIWLDIVDLPNIPIFPYFSSNPSKSIQIQPARKWFGCHPEYHPSHRHRRQQIWVLPSPSPSEGQPSSSPVADSSSRAWSLKAGGLAESINSQET